ncbi:MAG TPA: hypothetical protein VIQ05_18380 [Tardiphaga sp.]
MRLIPTEPRAGHAGIHPALHSFADECHRTIVHLVAYMGGLAFLVIVAVSLFDRIELETPTEAARTGWSVAARSHPAFAVSQFDSAGKTETYEILRHPDGGRKDVLRWAAANEKPIAELELYRPGREASLDGPPAAAVAARMDPDGARQIAGEGIVDSKFGPVSLFGFADRMNDAQRCLGFIKNLDTANLRISGWSCQGDGLPARRAAIACTLNRLILLTAGGDPRLAELFAHAELKRGNCASSSALATTSADWVTGAQNPQLRGSL